MASAVDNLSPDDRAFLAKYRKHGESDRDLYERMDLDLTRNEPMSDDAGWVATAQMYRRVLMALRGILTTDLRPCSCPECGRPIECASDLEGGAKPVIGDVVVCFGCGAVNEFGIGFRVVKASPATIDGLRTRFPDMWTTIQQISSLCRATK